MVHRDLSRVCNGFYINQLSHAFACFFVEVKRKGAHNVLMLQNRRAIT